MRKGSQEWKTFAPERALHERVASSAQSLGQRQKLGDALVVEPGAVHIKQYIVKSCESHEALCMRLVE